VGKTIVSGAGRGDTNDTIYDVIGLPTLEGFAVQLKLIIPEAPRTAVTFGTPGRGYGITVTESLWPAAFIATTVYVVVNAFLIPVTTKDLSLGPARFGLLLSGKQITL
jgi:hypothetical protein